MSKSESRKATSVLAFRMTPEESEALRAAAAMAGIGPTTFARRAAFAAAALPSPAYEARKPDVRKADLTKALGQLGRMASSANQLAKVANSSGTPAQSVALHRLSDELQALRKELVKAG